MELNITHNDNPPFQNTNIAFLRHTHTAFMPPKWLGVE